MCTPEANDECLSFALEAVRIYPTRVQFAWSDVINMHARNRNWEDVCKTFKECIKYLYDADQRTSACWGDYVWARALGGEGPITYGQLRKLAKVAKANYKKAKEIFFNCEGPHLGMAKQLLKANKDKPDHFIVHVFEHMRNNPDYEYDIRLRLNCHQCGEAVVLQVCSRCKQARYCSKECQRIHWKEGHNKACKLTSMKA
eukprot:TRINITY_DN6408_c0_g1_i1.p1 TRINITY_DN6408_c0_g1~~TRINITY_DN6408_c0_g1_i1.p1  ORF type:complete len:200 (-),score=34.42 TRINITY_DN6408_c0_g1_i1:6-605(-)